MSAFVSSCSNDVFISYATVDNKPLIPEDKRSKWVSELKRLLKIQVDERLGRSGSAEIWMDLSGIQGDDDLTQEIQEAIRGSAVMVCIVTEGYLSSDWCRREWELFVEACGGDATGRLYVIRRDLVDHKDDRWPEPFKKVRGYPFFHHDDETGRVARFGYPRPEPGKDGYFDRLEQVRSDLAAKLKEMAGKGSGAPVPARDPAAAGVQAGGETKGKEPATVYLGEVTPDMGEEREDVRRHLIQRGYAVVPEAVLDRGPDQFRQEAEAAMKGAIAFVQLFGPFCKGAAPGLPCGFEGAEAEKAVALGKPVIRWRSRDLERESVKDADHRGRVFGNDVIAMTLEEFKGHLEEQLRKIRERGKKVGGGVNAIRSGHYVLLRSNPEDEELAKSVRRMLSDKSIPFDLYDEEEVDLLAVTKGEDYQGLMVLFGNSDGHWVQQRVREFRQVVLDRNLQNPVCGICLDPRTRQEELKTEPPSFLLFGKDSIEDYVEALMEDPDS